MKFTRLQIVRTLKERDWTVSRSLWYSPRGHFKSIGISLREAASVEMLEASESLSAPRRKS
jgi:hypothetical protein